MRKLLWDQRTYAALVILVLLGSVLINFLVTGDDDPSTAADASATPSLDLDPTESPDGADGGEGGETLPTGAEPTSTRTDRASGLPIVPLSALPPEAEDTARLIADGGPYPYDDDGETFLNSAELLPVQPTGYYEVYTVDDPDAGAGTTRRLITGDGRELYWTDDLYESFERVDPSR